MATALLWAGPLASDTIDDVLSLVSQERHAEARALLEPLLESDPTALRVRLVHGILSAREGNLLQAVAIFEGLRDDYPDLFEAHNNLAVLYAGLGRLHDAHGALIKALELRPDAVAFANLGDVYMRLAQEAYERARELRLEDAVSADWGEEATAAPEVPAQSVEPSAAPTEDAAADQVPAQQEAEGAEASEPASAAPTADAAADEVPTQQEAEVAEASEPASAAPTEDAAADEVPAQQEAEGTTASEPATAAPTEDAAEVEVAAQQEAEVAEVSEPVSAAPTEDAAAVEVAAQQEAEVAEVSEPATAAPTADAAPDEVPTQQEAEGAGTTEPATADASDGACVVAGSFRDPDSVMEAAAWMQARDAQAVTIHDEEREEIKNHRVYLEVSASREDAAARVSELRERGVRDVGVIQSGPLANAVSLGVFRSESNVRRRMAELEALGYAALSTANRGPVTVYWVAARTGEGVSALKEAWASRFPDHPFQSAACVDPG